MNIMKLKKRLIYQIAVVVISISFLSSFTFAEDYSLRWAANTEPDLSGYKIYYKTGSSGPPYDGTHPTNAALNSPIDVGNVTEYLLPGLTDDITYYFVLTAYDTEGLESDYSKEYATSLVSLESVGSGFVINSNTHAAFNLSGEAEPSSIVTIFVNGTSTWDVAAAGDGAWTLDGDFTSISQGSVTLEARIIATGDSSGTITGTLDSVLPTFDAVPTVVGKTHNSATLSWVTSEETSSVLEYSAISGNPVPLTVTDANLAISHTMTITGLDPTTTYYFRVKATDAAGNTLTSVEDSFATTAVPDTTAPLVSPPTVTNTSNNTATISWSVNEPSDSVLEYTTTSGNYSGAPSVTDSGTGTRTATLTGLSGSTPYFYRVSATDTSGNGPTVTSEKTFTTLANPDVTAPDIIEPSIAATVNDTSATISWTTDEPSDSVVEYGLTTSYGSTRTLTADVTGHSVTLTGLSANSTYHFRVSSTDDDNNGPTYSSDKSFTTLETPDTTDPVITAPPTVTGLTDTSAVITWTTDEFSNSQVRFGTASAVWSAYPEAKNDIAMAKSHSVTLTGLSPGTVYFYRVGSTDGATNGPTVSAESGFVTEASPDIEAPQFTSPPTVTGKTETTAVIEWSTDEAATSLVQYGTLTSDWGGYTSEQNGADLETSHSITLTGLTGGTTYYFRAGSADALDNGPTTSQEITFTTADPADPLVVDERPRVTLPPTATGVTNTTATIEWETDEPATSEVRYGTAESSWDEYPLVKIDSQMTTWHSVTLSALDPETRYHFRVGSTDANDNGPNPAPAETNNPFSEDIFTTAADPDSTAPQIITAPVVAAADAISAIITWETDEPSTSLVQYGLSTAAWQDFTMSAADSTMVTQHTVTLTGLLPKTLYYFVVGSQDAAGNGPLVNPNATNPSAVGSVITPELIDEAAPVISDVTMTFATDTTALITWTTDEPANSMVQHGLITNTWGAYAYTESDPDMKTEHSVTITGLQPLTEYFFRIASTDAKGNGPDYNFNDSNPSTESSFTTDEFPDTEAPQIAGDITFEKNIAEKTVVVTWSTPDEPGSSQVQYDTVSNGWGSYAFTENDAEMVRFHSVTLTDMELDTLYFVRVSSVDASGNNYAASDNDLNPSIEYEMILESPSVDAGATTQRADDDEAGGSCFIQSLHH